MRLSPDLSLRLLEWGHGRASIQRALRLASLENPDVEVDALSAWSIGDRDRSLFKLYQNTFGDLLEGRTACDVCGVELEVRLSISKLTGALSRGDPAASATWLGRGYEVRFRNPTSHDLSAITDGDDLKTAEETLLRRCILDVRINGEFVPFAALEDDLLEDIKRAMAERDPYADIVLDATCAECEHAWQVLLDIGELLWARVVALAGRMVSDVHALCHYYGWSEAEVVAMSSFKRAVYLGMTDHG